MELLRDQKDDLWISKDFYKDPEDRKTDKKFTGLPSGYSYPPGSLKKEIPSVSRMSRNAKEGSKKYFHLREKGINLIFLKERHIDT